MPVKVAVGRLLARFYGDMVPTTPAMDEYVVRGFSKSFVVAPGRMVDQAEEVLALWRRSQNAPGAASSTAFLPVAAVAMAKDVTPIMGDWGMQFWQAQYVRFPDDPKARVFQLRLMQFERRIQLAFFASEEMTGRSMAGQFASWITAPPNRRFKALFPFAGIDHAYPCVLKDARDVTVSHIATGNPAITILTADLTLIENVPLFLCPKVGEPNDGKGAGFGGADPHGFPVVGTVTMEDPGARVNSVSALTPDGVPYAVWASGPVTA